MILNYPHFSVSLYLINFLYLDANHKIVLFMFLFGRTIMHDYAGDRTTGFASPAADAVEGPIDLSQILDLRKPSRYPVKVRGTTFTPRSILDGDVLIVDTAIPAKSVDLVIASNNGAAILAEFRAKSGSWWLISGNDSHEPILIDPTQDVDIWATVTGIVREKP
mgnify:CR=1 FL=1